MWNGLCGLFLKLEQGNLYNEINFDLPTNAIDNVTSMRRTLEAFVCPSNRKAIGVDTRRSLTDDQGRDHRSRRGWARRIIAATWRRGWSSIAPTPTTSTATITITA